MTETGFAEQFYASHRMGSAQILFKHFYREELKATPIQLYQVQPASFLIGQYL